MSVDKIKLNKFVLYVSSIAIALFVFAYSVGEVKAEVAYQSISYSGGNITIPSYEGDSLLLCFSALPLDTGFTIDSATSTNLFTYDNGSFPYVMGTVDYYLNPTIGNNTFSAGNIYYEGNCYLMTGIDSSNPYTLIERDFFDGYNSSFNNPTTLSNISATSSNSFLFTVSYGQDFNNVVWSLSDYTKIRQSQPSNFGSSMSFFRVSDLNASSYSFSWTNSAWALMKYYEIEFNEPSIPSNDYILYYGDDPYYQEIDEPIYLPFVYDICDTWSATSIYSVRLVDSLDNDIQENNKILTSCSGSNFVYPFSYDEDLSDDVRIVIFDEQDNVIVESEEFSFNIYTPLLSDSDFILYTLDNPLYINTDLGTGTEPIAFSYNVCSDSDFASSTFILKNISENIETQYTFTPSTCSGNTYINVPYNQYMNYTFPAKIIYKSGGDVLLESMPFQLVFYSNLLTDLSDLDEETATSTNIVVNFATTQLNKLKNIFPFNFPVAIITAWNNSKVERLNSDLDFLDIAENDGSLTASFPKEWALTENDIEFDFFSEDMITQGSSEAQAFFAKFKLFTKWLQYFLFAWAMIYFSKRIINDLTENKSDNI